MRPKGSQGYKVRHYRTGLGLESKLPSLCALGRGWAWYLALVVYRGRNKVSYGSLGTSLPRDGLGSLTPAQCLMCPQLCLPPSAVCHFPCLLQGTLNVFLEKAIKEELHKDRWGSLGMLTWANILEGYSPRAHAEWTLSSDIQHRHQDIQTSREGFSE